MPVRVCRLQHALKVSLQLNYRSRKGLQTFPVLRVPLQSNNKLPKEDTGQSTILFIIGKLRHYDKVIPAIGQEKNHPN
jgi:hypothetical protein